MTTYTIDYGKNSHVPCQTCKGPIDKGELRLMVQSRHHDGKDPLWHHVLCFFSKRKLALAVNEIGGFGDLRWEDQEALKAKCSALDDIHVANGFLNSNKTGDENSRSSSTSGKLLSSPSGSDRAERQEPAGCAVFGEKPQNFNAAKWEKRKLAEGYEPCKYRCSGGLFKTKQEARRHEETCAKHIEFQTFQEGYGCSKSQYPIESAGPKYDAGASRESSRETLVGFVFSGQKGKGSRSISKI